MKRKFSDKLIVFCTDKGETQILVDVEEYDLLSACTSTNENTAFCLIPHDERKTEFVHIELECPDSDNFAQFVCNHTCGANTDFVALLKLLNYLGASESIFDHLKECAKSAQDEIGKVSAWRAFGFVFQKITDVRTTEENIEFLLAHGHGLRLFPREYVSVPTCLHEDLLPFMSTKGLVFSGTALIPGCKFVKSAEIRVDILANDDQVKSCMQLCIVLLRVGYVILKHNPFQLLAIPPAGREWNNILVLLSCWTHELSIERSKRFFYTDSNHVQLSVQMKHDLKHGFEYEDIDDYIFDDLARLVISEKGRKALELAEPDRYDAKANDCLSQHSDSTALIFQAQMIMYGNLEFVFTTNDLCTSINRFCMAANAKEFANRTVVSKQGLNCPYTFAIPINVDPSFQGLHFDMFEMVPLRDCKEYRDLCSWIYFRATGHRDGSFLASNAYIRNYTAINVPVGTRWLFGQISRSKFGCLFWDTVTL